LKVEDEALQTAEDTPSTALAYGFKGARMRG
jgi:hypothetical protein